MVTTLSLDWIKKINPYYWDTLLEGEEIMWDTLWCFDETQWTERNAQIVRECGMIPIEVDGLLFVALGGCGMDLQPQLIYTQYKLTGWIEPDDVAYLNYQTREYVEYVIGGEESNELYKALETKKFI
jgi:hypothetical protein